MQPVLYSVKVAFNRACPGNLYWLSRDVDILLYDRRHAAVSLYIILRLLLCMNCVIYFVIHAVTLCKITRGDPHLPDKFHG